MLPLIDIVFLLLVFFIYAMLSMAVHNGLHLNLPESSQVERSEEASISIFLRLKDDDLQLWLNDEQLRIDELSQLLPMMVSEAESEQVLVFAEENVSYQQLFLVLDQLKMAGIEAVSLQANRQ